MVSVSVVEGKFISIECNGLLWPGTAAAGQGSLHRKLAAGDAGDAGDVEVQQQPHHQGRGEDEGGEALQPAGQQAGGAVAVAHEVFQAGDQFISCAVCYFQTFNIFPSYKLKRLVSLNIKRI